MRPFKKTVRAASADALDALVWLETAKQEERGLAPIAESYGRDDFGFVAHLEFAKEIAQ